jgi:hypothetical protein
MDEENDIETIILKLFLRKKIFEQLTSFKEFSDAQFRPLINLDFEKYDVINSFSENLNGFYFTSNGFRYDLHSFRKKILPNSIFFVEDGKIQFIQQTEEDNPNHWKFITETYLNDNSETNILFELFSGVFNNNVINDLNNPVLKHNPITKDTILSNLNLIPYRITNSDKTLDQFFDVGDFDKPNEDLDEIYEETITTLCSTNQRILYEINPSFSMDLICDFYGQLNIKLQKYHNIGQSEISNLKYELEFNLKLSDNDFEKMSSYLNQENPKYKQFFKFLYKNGNNNGDTVLASYVEDNKDKHKIPLKKALKIIDL